MGSRACVRDYLLIPATSDLHAANAEQRYCGAKLSSVHGDQRPKIVIGWYLIKGFMKKKDLN